MLLGLALVLFSGCKAKVSPHTAPEADADLLVAESLSTSGSQSPAHASAGKKLVLSINNAPGPGEPMEWDLLQKEIAEFEQANPGIQIEPSTWKFTPESFYDQAKNHTLTDVIEVSLAQMAPIIELNYAADITDLAANSPELARINPQVMKLFMRNGRTYGVPVELHTLALFYNRRVFDEAVNPKPAPATPAKPGAGKKSSPEKPKGKGAESLPREFLELEEEKKPPVQLAQFFRRSSPNYYDQYYRQEEGNSPSNRRGERAVQEYYNLSPRRSRYQQQPAQPPQQGSYYDYQQQWQNQYQQPGRAAPHTRGQQPGMEEEENTSARPGRESSHGQSSGELESAKPTRKARSDGDAETSKIDEDVITEGDAEETTQVMVEEKITTSVRTAGLPQDWDGLIRVTSNKLTNHALGVYGYAPNLFAREGGREFSQWGIQAGLEIEIPTADSATIDVNTSTAGQVAQFLKELRWKYDVTPPLEKCYNDSLMRMFAEGRVVMMTLPATKETFQQLVKLGMPLDDIGVAPLPQGPENRLHLTFGRCLIINSQLNRERREAAYKWLMFQTDPQRYRVREQHHFREQEITGIPRVPLYRAAVQAELNQSLKTHRTLPIFLDYEEMIASHLRPEPPFFTERLYEEIAQGVRPIVEQEFSKPMEAIATVGVEFEAKYLRNAPTRQGYQRYLKLLTGR